MKEHKTVENKFIWVPPDKRMSRFGGSVSPRKPETRAPVLRCGMGPNQGA